MKSFTALLTTLLPLLTYAVPHVPFTPFVEKRADSPTPRLAVYVQTFHTPDGQPLSLLPLLDNPTKITHVILAALHLQSDVGDIHLNDDPPNAAVFDQTWSEVKTLQQNGIKVLAMMGGAAQGSYQLLAGDDTSFQSYYQPLLTNVIRNYSLDGLDLDIEEDVDVSVPLRLINALYADQGPSFLITMAPVASALTSGGGDLSGFSYFDLDSQAVVAGTSTKLVTWYNAQFYSGFGDPSTPDGYESIISQGWDPSRVVMGVLDSPGDGNGFVGASQVESTVQALKSSYPDFGGVVGWEYWDAGSGDDIAQPWQWVQAIGDAVFGSGATKKARKAWVALKLGKLGRRRNGLEPRTPFEESVVRDLTGLYGAGRFQAVRALNLTGGDALAARGLLRAKLR